MCIKKYREAGSCGAKNTAKTLAVQDVKVGWNAEPTAFRVLREGMAGEVIATYGNK